MRPDADAVQLRREPVSAHAESRRAVVNADLRREVVPASGLRHPAEAATGRRSLSSWVLRPRSRGLSVATMGAGPQTAVCEKG